MMPSTIEIRKKGAARITSWSVTVPRFHQACRSSSTGRPTIDVFASIANRKNTIERT